MGMDARVTGCIRHTSPRVSSRRDGMYDDGESDSETAYASPRARVDASDDDRDGNGFDSTIPIVYIWPRRTARDDAV